MQRSQEITRWYHARVCSCILDGCGGLPLERCDSARAGGGALPVIMSIIRSSAKPTTTATTTSECAV